MISYQFLSDQLNEMAEYYGSATGYSDKQKDLLYKRLMLLNEVEIKNAFLSIRNNIERFPNPVQVLMHTRPQESDAAQRRKAEIIRKSGRCKYCQSTGMVIVRDVSNILYPNREVTMRCGECRVAELTGTLRQIHAWTAEQISDFPPTIGDFEWNENPSKGRLDEIMAMPWEERDALIAKEPWLKWCLAFYGVNKRNAGRSDMRL